MSYVTHTIIDRSGEKSFTRHHLPLVTAANYAAVTGNTPVTQNVGTLRAALGLITIGNFVKHEVTAYTTRTLGYNPIPTDENAQREFKVILRFTAAGRAYSVEIPCPDLSNIAQEGSDLIVPDVIWQELIDEIVLRFCDSYGNELAFIDGRIVGRRL